MDSLNRKKFRTSFLWSSILQLSALSTQFLSTVILARFLSPEDYGILGAIAIFIAIGDMIVDSGMGSSLIKKKNASEIDFSTLFIYNLSISLIVYTILYFSASIIADFYQIYNELDKIIRFLAIVVIIHALSIVQRIKILKELRFKALAVITICSNLLGLLVAIAVAVSGGGVWALVFQTIVTAIFLSIFYFAYNRYIPSFLFSIKSFKEQFKWGINLLLANMIRTVNENVYSSVIAKISTPIFVGYFTQATRVKNLPVGIMTQVVDKAVFPILSQYVNIEEFKTVIKKLNRIVLLFAIPILLFMGYLSKSIVYVVLGEQWLGASWTLGILLYSSIFLCIQSLYRNVFKSLGYTGCILKNEIAKFLISLLILFFTMLGDFKTILEGIILANFLGTAWVLFSMKHYLKYSILDQIKDVLSILAVCFLSFISLILIFITCDLPLVLDIALKAVCFFLLLIFYTFFLKIPERKYINWRNFKLNRK